jgi:predicted nucleic acid-binding protein
MASRELFVDTSAWVPLLRRHDADHRPVSDALKRRVAMGDRVVTTNLVIAETYTLLLYRGHRTAALQFLEVVRQPPNVAVYDTAELGESAAVDWLEPFGDQAFSYTDAVSFAVMRERKIRRALTLDHHFATAGFEMIPAAARG